MAPDDVTSRTAAPPDAVLRYADHEDGTVDLHLPHGADHASPDLVFLVHGGFWQQAWDRTHTRPLAEALRDGGYLVATPEYRRVGAGGTGGWPTTAHDVDRALAAVPGHLAELGLTTRGTILLGHSAGGHLVLWLATRRHRVARVVGLAPVGDLRAAARAHLGDNAVVDLLGGDPAAIPEVYDDADPAALFVERPATDVVILHGTDDDRVPVGNSRGLVAAYPWVELRELDGVGHFEPIDPRSDVWPTLLRALGPTGAAR